MKRLCPVCGSEDLWLAFGGYAGDGKVHCRNCDFVGLAIEGDGETARWLRENYERGG